MKSANSLDLGNSSIEEMRRVALESYGEQPDSSIDPVDQFYTRVVRVTRNRLSTENSISIEVANGDFAVFVLTSELREDRKRLSADRVANVEKGPQLAGHLWLVPSTLHSAGRRAFSGTTLGDAMDEIESLGLGNQPAIAIEFSKRTISFYPTGVEAEESVVRLEVGEEDLESTPVLNLLERFAEKFVVTPNCQESQIRTWLDGTNYIPVKAAEKNIQELLWLFLSSRLIDNHKIEMEHTLRSGRVDIVIRKRMAAGLWKTSAAVELKVVRSFSSTGRPTPAAALVKHIARGYKQIREYRKELEATEGWLVTYDMRKIDARGNDLYSPHSAAAVADELNLHLEALYGTADDYRDSCAA